MGLFDALGVGGGSLSIQLQSSQVQAGGMVQGVAVFTAGRRAQQLTNITVKLTCSRQVPQANGRTQQETRNVVPPYALTGAFTSQPGQSYQFPFQLQVPSDAFGSAPHLVTWRVSANADIDGEIDPGASAEVMVMGQAYQPHAMMPMGGPQHQAPMGKSPSSQGKGDPYPPYDPHNPHGQGKGEPYGQGKGEPYGQGKGEPYGQGKGGK